MGDVMGRMTFGLKTEEEIQADFEENKTHNQIKKKRKKSQNCSGRLLKK